MIDLNVDEMKAKALLVADPNSGYTIDDFNKDFSVTHLSEDSLKIDVKFSNKSSNPDPEYATAGSSGFDLRANLDSPITIPPHGVRIIPTGLYFEIPDNFEIQVRPRSGLAAKNSVTVLNTPGTVDADYRGEVKVILINHSEAGFFINHGDRIAQAVMSPVAAKNIVKLTKIAEVSTNTDRADGGFGSTGVK
jgi:dUTP pyrophosphatase